MGGGRGCCGERHTKRAEEGGGIVQGMECGERNVWGMIVVNMAAPYTYATEL